MTSFLCIFRLLFRHTCLIFYQKEKKLTQSPKEDDNSINYFCHFFSSFVEDTWKVFLATLPEIFFQQLDTLFQRPKTLEQFHFPLKTFKCSAGHVGCPFDKFAEILTSKVEKISSTRTKRLEQFSFIPKKRPEVVALKTLNVVLTILQEFFYLMVQTSLLEVWKWFEKTIFLQIFSSTFFYISRSFLWHPYFFC